MPRAFQVQMDAPGRHRVQGEVPDLATFAVDLQVLNAAAFLDVAHLQLRRFFAAQAVVEQHGQDGPIAQTLERGFIRRLQRALAW